MSGASFAWPALIGILGVLAAHTPSAMAEPRAVVELFTSQGCSSCPPADKLVGELAKDRTILALSLPIDYWDYLGWKDTLARPRHSARQRGYASARGDREVYTPQAVINGRTHVLGSDRAAIETAIGNTQGIAGALTIPVKLAVSDKTITVTMPGGKPPASGGEVWLCTIASSVPVTIARGENKGKTVTYNNVVRKWIHLGTWNGAARTFTAPKSETGDDDADSVAVLVQAGTAEKPGTILGASVASLR